MSAGREPDLERGSPLSHEAAPTERNSNREYFVKISSPKGELRQGARRTSRWPNSSHHLNTQPASSFPNSPSPGGSLAKSL